MIGHQETLLIGATVVLRRHDPHAQTPHRLHITAAAAAGPEADVPETRAAEGPRVPFTESLQLIAAIKKDD